MELYLYFTFDMVNANWFNLWFTGQNMIRPLVEKCLSFSLFKIFCSTLLYVESITVLFPKVYDSIKRYSLWLAIISVIESFYGSFHARSNSLHLYPEHTAGGD